MGDLAKAYVQIIPSARGMSSGLKNIINGEMPSGGQSAGGIFGSNLIGKIKAVVSTAAIGKAIASSVMAGADLQQSLGGDTEKAAQIADMAMTDISDNANKFGTDMGRITDAYQGFAKQNYTMLDNLKLGYGGTKTEMQRLLKDAQALTGVKYDINNLSDVYSAVHAIQEELGVTGTTALEASQTISGSFGSMKAVFKDVLANLALGRDIKPSLNALVKTTVTFLKGNLLPAVKNIFTALPGAVGTLLQALIPGSVQGVVTSLVTNFSTFMQTSLPAILENGVQMVSKLMAGFQSGFPGFIATVSELISQALTVFASALPSLMQSGVSMILQLVMGLLSSLPYLISAGGTIVQSLLTSFMAALPSILSTGVQYILSLAQGFLQSLPNIISSATTVVTNLLTTFASHLPDLLAQGISMIGQLVAGLISMIPDVISTALDIGQKIINTFAETDWLSIGVNIVNGIVSGVKNAAGALWGAMKDLANRALQAAKDALGIQSPSRKFRDLVGKFIPSGVAAGILGNMDVVRSAIRKMSEVAPDEFTSTLRINTRKGNTSGGSENQGGVRGVTVIQNIYSEAKTAADLMQEARYQAEMAVLLGV